MISDITIKIAKYKTPVKEDRYYAMVYCPCILMFEVNGSSEEEIAEKIKYELTKRMEKAEELVNVVDQYFKNAPGES